MLTISGLKNFYYLTDFHDMLCKAPRISEIIRTRYHRDPLNGDVYIFMYKFLYQQLLDKDQMNELILSELRAIKSSQGGARTESLHAHSVSRAHADKLLAEIYNCTFKPAFTIEQIVEPMKKATGLQRTIVKVSGSLLMTVASIVVPLGGKTLGICPARVKKFMISTNICGKKLADSGYKFHYTFEEAIKDWYRDNDNKYLR